MNAIVSCPECRRSLQVPDDFFGRKVQCPDCQHRFVAAPPDEAIQASPPAPASSAPAAWEEPPEEPRRRQRDEDHDEDREDDRYDDDDDLEDLRREKLRQEDLDPDRGGTILALGIVSTVLAFFSFGLYFIPLWLIPLVLGIIGWVMGHRDLRAMREGSMDRTNHTMTLVGMIFSIVGVAISACVAALGCFVVGLFGLFFCGIAANAPGGAGRPGGPRRF